MKLSKTIVNTGLPNFVIEVLESAEAGWELDPANMPGTFGIMYECRMLRDEEVTDEVKQSRADILARARAAKAAKRGGTQWATS